MQQTSDYAFRLRGKALHTFVCRSALQRRTKRAEAAQSGARMVPSWPKHVRVVRAGGLEPPRPVRVCGFSYHFGFRRLARRVRGLDYPFTIPRERLRCCPSSLYTFPKTSGLGSGLPFKVSPTLSSSTPPVSRRALNLLKSAASAISPRPREIGHSPIIKQAAKTVSISASCSAAFLLAMELECPSPRIRS